MGASFSNNKSHERISPSGIHLSSFYDSSLGLNGRPVFILCTFTLYGDTFLVILVDFSDYNGNSSQCQYVEALKRQM